MATEEEEEEATAVVSGEEDEELDISNSDVCTKYREAAKIANLALQGIILQAKAGTKVVDLCKFGDSVINQKCAAIYTKKVKGKIIEKGIAFPTCISLNECASHFCPLESDTQIVLKAGDMVKADVGCHVDGYASVAAHTFIIPSEEENANISGPQADVMSAAHIAAEVAIKLLQPGNTNSQITQAIAKVADSYGVSAVAGVLSHRMKRFVIDGNKVIILKEDVDQKVETFTFETNEVYSIDIVMSTGDGKLREAEQRATVFKRAVDKNYRLKMRASRNLFSEVNLKYPALPFTLRHFDDERQARMGVVECIKHELLHTYPVLYAKQGDLLCQYKFTVLILPSGPTRITGLPSFGDLKLTSDKELDPELATIMAQAAKKKKKKPRKKNTTTSGITEDAADD